MRKHRRLWDAYRFPGFLPQHRVSGIFGDPQARVIGLNRRGKKQLVEAAVGSIILSTIGRSAEFGTCLRRYADLPGRGSPSGLVLPVQESETRKAGLAGRLSLLYQAVCFLRGPSCRDSSIRDVAKELHLDWKTVKSLEKQYMREQVRRKGAPRPKVLGIDEVSLRKGHTYRMVVSDLERLRPIWFGGKDRSEASLDLFFEWLGPKKSQRIRLASWTCGRLSVTRLRSMLLKRLFCSISSCDASSQRGLR